MLVQILLPLALKELTYNVPAEFVAEIDVGKRVLVPIGKRKVESGIIVEIINDITSETSIAANFAVKDIICVIDNKPIITPLQLKIWYWVANYYVCTAGEVMKAALPAQLKLESESKVILKTDDWQHCNFNNTQLKILDFLDKEKYKTIEEISKYIGIKSVLPQLQMLIENNVVELSEAVAEKYILKTQKYIRLTDAYSSEQKLQEVLDNLRSENAKKIIYKILEQYEEKAGSYRELSISQDKLIKEVGCSVSVLKTLISKGIIEVEQVPISRLSEKVFQTSELHQLNNIQRAAFDSISDKWKTNNIVLLHGVTSSGKTEVYIHLAKKAIDNGRKVLYLVPEIALTTQLTDRLSRVFGKRLGVYHSKFSDSERAEIYYNILSNDKYDIVIGVRSSVLLPFSDLGLIIVDEEHESSYKQQEPAPRYNAKYVAMMMASFYNAKLLLGSATPSIESYYNAQIGKYGLVTLSKRYNDINMPSISLIDLKEKYHKKEIEGHFSDEVINAMKSEITRKKQVIVFQNRRGYAHYLECKECAYVPKCLHCDVSLTYHKNLNSLVCHYCGYTISVPNTCPNCGSKTLSDRGIGTEKAETELTNLLPNVRIARMDLDTTRNKRGYEALIDDFSNHKYDVLVGTQMVSKGLDFSDVSTVVIVNADSLINQPDFRSTERTFQMLEQVSGRAGRKDEQGMVYLQTRNPQNVVFDQVKRHDYLSFYQQQIEERKMFKYPPFYRLILIEIRHRDINEVVLIANDLQNYMHAVFTHRCSKVIIPNVAKMQNLFRRQVLLKVESSVSFSKAKQLLCECIKNIKSSSGKNAQFIVDVDPL